jgi:hypothetical protein
MFALIDAYDAPADQATALREYVKDYGDKGGLPQLATAYQRLGDALWQQACPVKTIDGVCAKIAPDKAQHCSDTARLEIVPRTATTRREALAAYDQALKIASEARLDDPASRHATAMARLAQGNDLLETTFANKVPSAIDETRFSVWLSAQTKAVDTVDHAYEEVLATKDATASIEAAARVGQLSDQFFAAMVTSEIPAAVRTGAHATDKVKAYCDQMSIVAAPLHERAQSAFGMCVTKSMELGVFDSWTALCRRETHTTVADTQPELTLSIPLAGDGGAGEKAWHAGRHDEAMLAWLAALRADGKLFGPHIDLAIGDLERLHAMARSDPERKPLAADAAFQARSALAVRHDALPYVVLAMIALEEGNHLDLAQGLIDQALRDDDKSPVLYAAHAVIDARRTNWTLAWAYANRAMTVDPKSEVALRISGLVAAHVGAYDTASERLAKLKDQTYEVMLARAIAARALGDTKSAEALDRQARDLGPSIAK